MIEKEFAIQFSCFTGNVSRDRFEIRFYFRSNLYKKFELKSKVDKDKVQIERNTLDYEGSYDKSSSH